MIAFTDMTGLGSAAIVVVTAAMLLPGVSRLSAVNRIWLICAVVIIALVPLNGLSLASYVRGVTGDLSITSVLLLLSAIWNRGLGPRFRASSSLLLLVVIVASVLYPLALGFGSFDPYRLGYGDPWFLAGLLAITLVAMLRQSPEIVLVVSMAVLAWGLGWYESNNLWDYLLDPLVSIYAAGGLIKRIFQGQWLKTG